MEVSGRRFHCWKRSGHGSVNLLKSLVESCDVYYYDIALKVGIEKIADMGRRLGLGVRFDVPMSSVKGGVMPTRGTKTRLPARANMGCACRAYCQCKGSDQKGTSGRDRLRRVARHR
jgi:cell division protein FtsI/penicillin-binding protein 2